MNDPLPHELVQEAPAGTYLVDAYEDWAKDQGIPILTGPAVDLLAGDVSPWARFDAKGAFCHVDGRCDFLSIFLLEIAAGKSAAPQRHLYEELCYVLSGTGETDIETAAGKQTVSWGPRSLFSMPMNARYRHRNTGSTPARIAGINDMRYLFNLFRNEEFVFGLPMDFSERAESSEDQRDGSMGKHLATSSVMDLGATGLSGSQRVINADRLPISMCEGSISADLWQLDAGTSTDAIRQFQGVHLFGVSGDGYSVVTDDGQANVHRAEWHHGVVFSAPAMLFYQHINESSAPLRFMTTELGSIRYPMFRHRRADYGDSSVYAAGRAVVPGSR